MAYIEQEALLSKLREKAYEWRGTFTADGFAESAKIVENFPVSNVAPIPQWISVKDRLPDEEQDVYILVREVEHYGERLEGRKVYRSVYTGWLIDGEWATYYCHGHKYLKETEAETNGREEYTVTHWMPFGELPEGQ